MRQFLSREIKENGLWKTQYSNRKKTPAHNSVLAKDGVNIVFEYSVNNIRKNAFYISFFRNLEI
jgi:hypothetical protein